jgi:hypothetical protein
LGAKGQIQRLPPSEIPREIRRQDENLHYAVLNRFQWKDYYVGISDHESFYHALENTKAGPKLKIPLRINWSS